MMPIVTIGMLTGRREASVSGMTVPMLLLSPGAS
jgi:hypothetical protein